MARIISPKLTSFDPCVVRFSALFPHFMAFCHLVTLPGFVVGLLAPLARPIATPPNQSGFTPLILSLALLEGSGIPAFLLPCRAHTAKLFTLIESCW